ncbi:hypothetical protein VA7868_00089 [Vibrio aerogenes CECT 7868]|uniref:Solute-binding protein family 3/N-terminal domain-containing protein n=1 Tax=Vibrio aerogenes CECT 7868 TaxID=1216006 RepID=A0A1M5UGX0_9VIBR|nr:hypothetical protein [Vibrio aerogenes]SHH62295.1 hypothetical protein VA7868_00089 [Vibrio aerogenes CECT 7868]
MLNTGRSLLLWLALLTVFVTGVQAAEKNQQPFIISIYTGATEQQNQLLKLIYSELFAGLGIEIKLRAIPMKRASAESAEGIIDGEAVRVASYSESHPNLRLVNVPVVQVTFVTFGDRQTDFGLKDGWDSLFVSDFRIGYRRGIVYSEQRLKSHVPGERLDESKTAVQGIKKMLHGRTDLFVYTLDMLTAKDDVMNNIKVVSVLDEVPLFLHVHKKHASLIPQLEHALIKMKKRGRLTEICAAVYPDNTAKHCEIKGTFSSLMW